MKIARSLLMATTLLPTALWGADINVSYLVNLRALKSGAPSGTALMFTLYSDNGCATQVASQMVNVENIQVIESLKLLTPKGECHRAD